MGNGGLVNELREIKPRDAAAGLATRDVRAPKPLLARGFVIRMETLRRLLRVSVLGALDVASIFLAIWTALELKAAVNDKSDLSLTFSQAKHWAPLACLVTVLLFARSRMYGDRPVRPGFTGIVGSLFQVTAVIFLYAIIQGQHFSSYYIFYGTLFFAIAYVSLSRWTFDWVTWKILSAAGYRRRAVLVGTGSQIDAVAHALGGGQHSQLDPVGFVSLTPREGNGLEDLGPLDRLEEHFDQIDEVLIADPDFPQEEAVDLVDRCHRAGIRVRVAPSTMEILMDRVEFIPGQTVPLFELKPPVFEGVDFVVKRGFDLVVAALLLVVLGPLLLLAAAGVKLTSRGPVVYRSIRRGVGGQQFACFKFRTMYADADSRQATLEESNEK